METPRKEIKDERIERILTQIRRLSRFDCTDRVELSARGDEIDAVSAGLNTLAEELDARVAYIKNNEKRINDIMGILMEYTMMNFTRKMYLSEEGDEIDAISAGLNTLAEELEHAIKSQKEHARELEISNRLLSNNIDKLQTIFNHAPMAIIATDLELKILEWNRAAEKMYGLEKEAVVGENLDDVIHHEYMPPFSRASILSEIKQKGNWTGEMLQQTAKSKKMLVFSSKSHLRNDRGIPMGYMMVNRDITDARRNEEEIQHKTEELKRSNAELEQFAYIASHDLQEPLRMITSYVQLLEKRYRSKLDGDAIDFINFAVDGANRMQNLIYSLLEYSRINRVKPFEYVDMDETLADIKDDLELVIKESGAEIHSEKLPVLFGDKVLLGQLFQNLIGNAMKFKGKDPPKITISCKESEHEYLFSVKDNGIGIQKEYCEKIFVIFQRLHTKEKYPGTGIGLAICKKIVERHKGRIWVESEPGKGSEFIFTIKKMRFSELNG